LSSSRRVLDFEVKAKVRNGRARLTLRGELDVAQEDKLAHALGEARQRCADIVVDLSGLTYIDSTGIRLLLVEAERARREGRGFGVIVGSGEPRRMLDLLGLDGSVIRRV
jgi:anti-anti-sigma factor